MGLSNSEELGRAIATSLNNSEQIKQDAIPAEIINSMLIAPIDRLKVTLSVVGTKLSYDPTSFILDHPVYGELDSSTLELDGGYLVSETGSQFDLTFANNGGLGFSFDEESIAGSTVLFTYNS